MDFEDHLHWLIELSSVRVFKKGKEEFIKNHQDGKVKKINQKKGFIEGEVLSPDSNEWESYTIKFDQFILDRTLNFVTEPVSQIISPLKESQVEERLKKGIQELALSLSIVNDHPFYSDFPDYITALKRTIDTLRNLKKKLGTPTASRDDKTQKAYDLEDYLDIILDAGSHELAVKILKDNVEGFEWDRPNKSFFFNDAEGFNKTQVGHALVLIGKIKWPDGYPKISTIKKAFLDNR